MNAFFAVVEFVSDVVVLATVIAAWLFLGLYQLLFDPSTTTAGRAIRRVVFALAVYGTLSVVRIFIPGTLPWWWELVRLAVYLFIAYSFISLTRLIVVRRFWPDRLRTRPHTGPVEIEPDTLQPRTTGRVADADARRRRRRSV